MIVQRNNEFVEIELQPVYLVTYEENMIFEFYFKKMKELEKKVILNVLNQYLLRQPTVDDFKKCSRGFHQGQFDKYVLSYNNTGLGEVQYIFCNEENQCKFKVLFTSFK